MSVSSEPEVSAQEPAASKPQGTLPPRPHVPDPFLDGEPTTGDNSKAMYTLAAAVGAGTLLIAFGLVMSRVGGSNSAQERSPMTTTLSEQHKMMREAVQMAKDVQDVQRERLELMRREVEASERRTNAPTHNDSDSIGD